jgi:hypothetical protein
MLCWYGICHADFVNKQISGKVCPLACCHWGSCNPLNLSIGSPMVPLAPSIGGHLDPQGNPFGGQQRPLGVHLPGAGPPIRTLVHHQTFKFEPPLSVVQTRAINFTLRRKCHRILHRHLRRNLPSASVFNNRHWNQCLPRTGNGSAPSRWKLRFGRCRRHRAGPLPA